MLFESDEKATSKIARRDARDNAPDIENEVAKLHQVQNNKNKPSEQVNCEIPVILTSKGQPLILSWIPN